MDREVVWVVDRETEEAVLVVDRQANRWTEAVTQTPRHPDK